MARIFITGSSDGLGLLAAKALIEQGHKVVLHARTGERKKETQTKVTGSEAILVADLFDLEATKDLAAQVNALGAFDVVIHNAGVYTVPAEQIVNINVLSPYVLTSLINKPKRLIYLSSSMHLSGSLKLEHLKSEHRKINYSDSKLHVLMLALAVARKWKDVYSNALDPGWVPTKMGGKGAPDDLTLGYATQVWLAGSNDERAKVSGNYFFHQQINRHHRAADDTALQERFLSICQEITGVPFANH